MGYQSQQPVYSNGIGDIEMKNFKNIYNNILDIFKILIKKKQRCGALNPDPPSKNNTRWHKAGELAADLRLIGIFVDRKR